LEFASFARTADAVPRQIAGGSLARARDERVKKSNLRGGEHCYVSMSVDWFDILYAIKIGDRDALFRAEQAGDQRHTEDRKEAS